MKHIISRCIHFLIFFLIHGRFDKILSLLQERKENWAILLCTSRYYYNYRHYVNALSVYKTLKDAGFRDDRILFLNTENEVTCDTRNPYPGLVYSDLPSIQSSRMKKENKKYDYTTTHIFFNQSFTSTNGICSDSSNHVEVDYIGDEVTVDAFLRLFDGRIHSLTEISRRLDSTTKSNIFVYMTGHGGDEFFKFHDTKEMTARDLGNAIKEMYEKDRFREILLVIDTCQAATMCNYMEVPGVYCIGGSGVGENSYAYEPKQELGLPVTDRFTLHFTKYIQREVIKPSKSKMKTKKSIIDLMNSMDKRFLFANPILMDPVVGSRHPSSVALAEFFTPATKEYKDTTIRRLPMYSEDSVSRENRTYHYYDFDDFFTNNDPNY